MTCAFTYLWTNHDWSPMILSLILKSMRSHGALIIRVAPSDTYKGCRCLIVQMHNKKKNSLVHALISFWWWYPTLLVCGLNATSLSLVMLEVALIRLCSRHRGIDMDLSSWYLAFSGKRDYLPWPKSSQALQSDSPSNRPNWKSIYSQSGGLSATR